MATSSSIEILEKPAEPSETINTPETGVEEAQEKEPDLNKLGERADTAANEGEQFGKLYLDRLSSQEVGEDGQPLIEPGAIEQTQDALETVNTQIEVAHEQFRRRIAPTTPEKTAPLETGPEQENGIVEILRENSIEAWTKEPDQETLNGLDESLDEETRTSREITSFKSEYTPEEKQKAREASNAIVDGLTQEQLENLGKNEKNNETLLQMIRLSIKVGAYVAEKIARNIAKDKDTPQELRIALGFFADLIHDGGKLANRIGQGSKDERVGRGLNNRFSPTQPEISPVEVEVEPTE